MQPPARRKRCADGLGRAAPPAWARPAPPAWGEPRLRSEGEPRRWVREAAAQGSAAAPVGASCAAGHCSRRRRPVLPMRSRGGASRGEGESGTSGGRARGTGDGVVRSFSGDDPVPGFGGWVHPWSDPVPLSPQPNSPKRRTVPSHPSPSPKPNGP